jgi:ADP-ribosylglycohydrolase
MRRAQRSLQGLSVGDAFGERYFIDAGKVDLMVADRRLPAPPWRYSDDTVMALSIVETLEQWGSIDQDDLAERFAAKYGRDPARGYGGTAHGILSALRQGHSWRQVSPLVFGGMGSMGNGGAMRAGPLGAYFADDLSVAMQQARLSAEVTHAHVEGQAGAIAIAVAAAWATHADEVERMFEAVLDHTPDGSTRATIALAARLPLEYDVRTAASALGNGSRVIAEDTVPLALWCAARHLHDYESALWTTVSGLGDRDTTCAIVGSIVALVPGVEVPVPWLSAREPLENMAG